MSETGSRTVERARYVGFCYDSTGWGGDLSGVLLREYPDGWEAVAGHISSDARWAEHDIRWHFDRRENADDADSFEWVGRAETQADMDRIAATYPARHALQPAEASDD